MSRNSQRLFTGPHAGVPPSYEMLKEEHEVAVLGAPQISAPVTTTVVNIQPETAVPDHVVWSLFNTLFFKVCCLGFVAFAYSVKVGGCLWACQESGFELWGLLPRWPVMGEPFCLCMWVCRPQGGKSPPTSPVTSLSLTCNPRALSERTKGLPHPDPWWDVASRGGRAGKEVPRDPRRACEGGTPLALTCPG